MVYIILTVTIVLAISVLSASKFEKIANMKGHHGYFWWCFLLGAIGWAMVIALPDRGTLSVQDLAAANQGTAELDNSLPEL